jgi:uncharacterized membrane protein YeaQ/YmgE (transglycosylase-associated protein family)
MLLNIILWVVFGSVAGWVASILMNRDANIGAVAKILVGVVGAIMGGLLLTLLGIGGVTGFNPYSVIEATLGTTGVLFLVSTV